MLGVVKSLSSATAKALVRMPASKPATSSAAAAVSRTWPSRARELAENLVIKAYFFSIFGSNCAIWGASPFWLADVYHNQKVNLDRVYLFS